MSLGGGEQLNVIGEQVAQSAHFNHKFAYK